MTLVALGIMGGLTLIGTKRVMYDLCLKVAPFGMSNAMDLQS